MKKIILLSLITSFSLFANTSLINENLLKSKQLEKDINNSDAMKIKTNLINDVNFNFDFNKNYIGQSYDNDKSSFNVSFNQDIFKSGGILYSLEASDIYKKISNLNYEISLDNIIKQIVDIKYDYEINSLNLTINSLNNLYIEDEKDIAEEEYKAGIGSFLNINQKTISLNNNIIEKSNFNNNIKILENNFNIFSSKKIDNFVLPVFNEVNLTDFLNSKEINLMKEQTKYQTKLLDIEKTNYLPKISLYGSYNDDLKNSNDLKDNNSTVGLKISMPLKLTKNYNIESLKLTNLKNKIDLNEKIRTKEIDYLSIQQNIENFNNNIKTLENISLNWLNNFKEKENEYKAKIISKKQLDLFELQYKISIQNILLEKMKKNKYIASEYIYFAFNKY